MISFLWHHLFSFRFRSLGMVFVSSGILLVLGFSLFLFRNVTQALEYYGVTDIDPSRVVFTVENTVFDMFAHDAGGITPQEVEKIFADTRFRRVRALSFVDTNIVGGFDIFAFHLDFDVPVFTLRDSFGDMDGFGISPSMIHFYNLELAGTHPMFPTLDAHILQGKRVSLTFGTSKLFQSYASGSSPLKGSIVSIDRDYPGFGVVAPLSRVSPKLGEIGVTPQSPYRIIAYMQNISDQKAILEAYTGLHITFDIDREKNLSHQLSVIRWILFGSLSFFVSIFLLFFVVLLSGYFRERASVGEILRVYGVSGWRAFVLWYGEITLLLVGSGMIFGACISLFQSITLPSFVLFLHLRGVTFLPYSLSFSDFFLLIGVGVMLFFFLVFLVSRRSGAQ